MTQAGHNPTSKIENRKSKISLIAAMSENGVIGRNNTLPWRLPDDLKRFKQLTTGHTVVMGRKTFQSIGKPLPHRRNIVVTRNPGFQADGVELFHDLTAAVSAFDPGETFIIGGGQLYRAALALADRIYLTLVHTQIEGDAYFPNLEEREWKLVDQAEHPADEKHEYAMSFQVLQRVK